MRAVVWWVVAALGASVGSCDGMHHSSARDIPAEASSPDTGPSRPVPKGQRILVIDVQAGADQDYDRAFKLARSAGLEAVSLSLNWDDVESSPGRYATPWLGIANAYYPVRGVRLALSVRPLDTNGSHLPKDLQRARLDDPAVIERFNRFLNDVLSQIPDVQLTAVSIGNEVDAALDHDPARYAQYETFYRAAAQHVHSVHPELKVGVAATLYALIGADADRLEALNRHSDVIMATYYPLHTDLTVKDPDVITAELGELIRRYPGRPVHLLEIGYPSSQSNGSSETKQEHFIRQAFAAWDTYASAIEYLSFSWLTDLSPEAVARYRSYYGWANPRFLDYLRTLGLRTYEDHGRDKPAFTALQVEAKARGW